MGDERLIEAVARALCVAAGNDPDSPICDIYVPDDPHAGIPWAGYRNDARAALAAIRASGYAIVPTGPGGVGLSADLAWTAMVSRLRIALMDGKGAELALRAALAPGEHGMTPEIEALADSMARWAEVIRETSGGHSVDAAELDAVATALRAQAAEIARLTAERDAAVAALAAATSDDWRNDPSADERWSAGCDFAICQLAAVLGTEPSAFSWDAATEELDGDVRAIIGNALAAGLGEDWQDRPTVAALAQREAECARLRAERDVARRAIVDDALDAFDMLTLLRGAGWRVAVHNDYRQHGQEWTFWLLTHPNGRWIKGEGVSDALALDQAMRNSRALSPIPADPDSDNG